MKFRGPGNSIHPAKEAQRRQARALRSLQQAVGGTSTGPSVSTSAAVFSVASSEPQPQVEDVWRFELGDSETQLTAVHIPTGRRFVVADAAQATNEEE